MAKLLILPHWVLNNKEHINEKMGRLDDMNDIDFKDVKIENPNNEGDGKRQACGRKMYTQTLHNFKVANEEKVGEVLEFKIHPDSGITNEDIDTHLTNDPYTAFGNNVNSFQINGKWCTIMLLQENQDVNQTQFDKLRDLMLES